MATLILTVGLPRSGKSTWARERGCPIVCPDSIRVALHGHSFLREAEPMVWAMAKYMVHALFLSGHETVILDATNVTEKSRMVWDSPHWDTTYHLFPAPVGECCERAKAGHREDLLPVIWEMALQIEWPETHGAIASAQELDDANG